MLALLASSPITFSMRRRAARVDQLNSCGGNINPYDAVSLIDETRGRHDPNVAQSKYTSSRTFAA
jgi:hypothetical protein